MSEENKLYEISYLAKSETSKEAVLSALASISAKDIQEVKYTETKLAYPIKKISLAFFGCIIFEATTENVIKINNLLKLKEEILRFIIVTPPIKTYSRFYPKNKSIEQSNVINSDSNIENKVIDSVPNNIVEQEEVKTVAIEPGMSQSSPKTEIDDEALNEKLEEILSGTK